MLRSRTSLWLSLAGWLVVVYALAALAALGSMDAPNVYASFNLPDWAPPAGVFGPVWSLLYTLMAVSGWLIWRQHGFQQAGLAHGLFAGQLLLNVAWSWCFFAWLNGLLAFINISALLCVLVLMLVVFWRAGSRTAALLQLPYVAWVSFAACLNFSVWQLNPALLG